MNTTSYKERSDRAFRRTVILAALTLALPAVLLFVKADYYFSIVFNSPIVLHLCHVVKTVLPSTLNLIFLIAALALMLSVPAGLLRSLYHFARGITYPAFLQPRVSSLSRGEIREIQRAGNYRVIEIDSHVPFAYAGGVIEKNIIVSRPLRELLSAEEYDAVLLHEAGHLRMNHPIKRVLISSLLLSLYILPTRKEIWQRFRSLTELAADEFAVSMGVKPATLASAIVKVAKNKHMPLTPSIAGFTSSQIKERIHALLGIDEGGEKQEGGKKRISDKLWRTLPAVLLLLFLIQPFLTRPDGTYCAYHADQAAWKTPATTTVSVCTAVRCEKCDICSPAHRKHL